MEKTVVELFAGVGGFGLGLMASSPDWKFVMANQWEPGKKKQWAFDCYRQRFVDGKIVFPHEELEEKSLEFLGDTLRWNKSEQLSLFCYEPQAGYGVEL